MGSPLALYHGRMVIGTVVSSVCAFWYVSVFANGQLVSFFTPLRVFVGVRL